MPLPEQQLLSLECECKKLQTHPSEVQEFELRHQMVNESQVEANACLASDNVTEQPADRFGEKPDGQNLRTAIQLPDAGH